MFLWSKIFQSQEYLQDAPLLFHRAPLPLPSSLPQRQADVGGEPVHDDRYRQVGQSTRWSFQLDQLLVSSNERENELQPK